MVTVSQILTNIIMFVQTLNYVNNGIFEAWDTRTFDFNHHDNMTGYLTIENAQASLIMGPYEIFAFASVVEDGNGNFRACVNNVTFPDLNVTFDYFADFGINDKYPFYGRGTYRSNFNNVSTSFCWLLSPTAEEILDFNIDVNFRHGPAELTGVFNNNELNPIIFTYLTLAKKVFAMWNSYEQECAKKCVLNPVLFFMTNYLIFHINKSEELDWDQCSCIFELSNSIESKLKMDESLKLKHIYGSLGYLIEDVFKTKFVKISN